MTNYAWNAVEAVRAELPGEDPTLIRLYALLALAKGAETTMQDVHDAWSLYRAPRMPDHPSLIPFAELATEVQELDRPYMEAIHRAATRATGEDGTDG